MATESIAQQGSIGEVGAVKETVEKKGVRLYRAGRVTHLQGDKYQVVGDTGTYEVNPETQECDCPSRLICSHIFAATISTAKANARANAELEAKRDEAKERGPYSPDTSQNNAIAAALDRMGA